MGCYQEMLGGKITIFAKFDVFERRLSRCVENGLMCMSDRRQGYGELGESESSEKIVVVIQMGTYSSLNESRSSGDGEDGLRVSTQSEQTQRMDSTGDR